MSPGTSPRFAESSTGSASSDKPSHLSCRSSGIEAETFLGGARESPGAIRAKKGGRSLSQARVIAVVCSAQLLAQIGSSAVPALLPPFFAVWGSDERRVGKEWVSTCQSWW